MLVLPNANNRNEQERECERYIGNFFAETENHEALKWRRDKEIEIKKHIDYKSVLNCVSHIILSTWYYKGMHYCKTTSRYTVTTEMRVSCNSNRNEFALAIPYTKKRSYHNFTSLHFYDPRSLFFVNVNRWKLKIQSNTKSIRDHWCRFSMLLSLLCAIFFVCYSSFF